MEAPLPPFALLLLLVWGGACLRSEELLPRDRPGGTEPSVRTLQDPERDVDAEIYSGAGAFSGEAPATQPLRSSRAVVSTTRGPQDSATPRPAPAGTARRDWSLIGTFTTLVASLGLCVLSWCCRDLYLRHKLTFCHCPRLRLPHSWLRPFRRSFQTPVVQLDSGKEELIPMEEIESLPPFLSGGTHLPHNADLPSVGAEDPQDGGDMAMVERNGSTHALDEGTEALLD